MWTCGLDEAAAADRRTSGGKGAGLARLIARSLPVPRGFAILPEAMIATQGPIEGTGDPAVWSDAAVRAESARRAEILLSAPLPDGFESELRARLASFGDAAIAVRSSAEDEDGALRSAAGQHDTFLRVHGIDEVLIAIRRCWASVHGHRAAIYRSRTGRPPFDARAAVLIQEMVEAEAAGVVFTRDPMSPARDRLVIEASTGTGERVAGGEVAVDRWEITRGNPARGREPAIARRLPAGGESTPVLGDREVLALARLALEAERLALDGGAADLEWAYTKAGGFVLLQIRPITPAARPPSRRTRGILWTQRFSGERWTEPATALGWSIVEPALDRYTHWPWASAVYLKGTRLARLHGGTPYFNVSIFRFLLPKTPWTPTPEFILELFPPGEQEELRRRRWYLPSAGFIALILAEVVLRARWRGHRWAWFTNPRDWSRLAPRISDAAAGANRSSRDLSAALREIDRLRVWLDRYVGTHVWSLLWANLFYQALGVFLEKFGGPKLHRLRPALVAGAGQENLTLRTNVALWRLAATAHTEREVEAILLATPSISPRTPGSSRRDGEIALDALRHSASPGAARFLASLDRFLERHGHRSRATWEIFSRRWRDEPGTVLEMVRAYLQAGISADPFVREEEMIEARSAAEKTLDQSVSGWRLRLVRWSLRHARVFSLLRENQRFVFDELMTAIRDVTLVAAQLLERERKLQDSGDVVHLALDEVRALATGDLSAVEAARRISVRRREAEEAARVWAPTFLYEDDPVHALPSGRVLRGVGVSPGRYTGRARIARSLADLAHLQPGEILVVKATDPGWTPYFASAGGLVSELGGLLSHAAVIAREYGLPAVVNITDATTVFANGDSITLDGDTGQVWPDK